MQKANKGAYSPQGHKTGQWCVLRQTPRHHYRVYGGIVFLDKSNSVKLGDFGLSKVLTQARMANTYIGVCSSRHERRCRRSCHLESGFLCDIIGLDFDDE